MVFVYHTSRFAVGTSAVYIFFCLSGFWIYKMYTGRYSATRQPLLTYAVSRLWRLLPTFWLITLLTFIFLYFNGTLVFYWNEVNKIHFIVSNIIIFGYQTLYKLPIDPAWSLDIELQFYVIAPFLAILFALKKVKVGWLLLAFAAISVIASLTHNPVALLDFLVYFVIGMAAASSNWQPSGKFVLISVGAAALLLALCLVSPWRGILLVGAHPGPLATYNPHLEVVLALLAVPYAIFTTRQEGFAADGMFADLSYIIYLLHWSATIWINSHGGTVFHRLINMAMGWITVICVSILIWKVYDRPINRMRSRWVSKRKISTGAMARLSV